MKYEIVVPVNIGWRKSGTNIMGRGMAKEAVRMYPKIESFLGGFQKDLWDTEKPPMDDPRWIIKYPWGPLTFFPTKVLNHEKPWMSWSNKSDKETIGKLLIHLPVFANKHGLKKLAIPLLGAGNGGLDPFEMKDLIREKIGSDPRFTLVTYYL
ncbi:MAG: hypothetical protein HC814_03790 [Rhodobacteraceae bacterium]|nr:hypothetical protein [Paracoccaceae bacterium]